MIIDKEYPATHSMSTAWYCVDEDGNVGIVDIHDYGPIPDECENEKEVNDMFWYDFSSEGSDGVRDLTTIYTDFAAVLFDLVVFWVFLISMGYLAVVICASVLKGNRFNGLLSLVVFFVIAYIVEDVNDSIEEALAIASKGTVASSIYDVIFYVILTVVMYVITSWIMDNKLSV